MPTSTISANSAMRTKPASTIGEIGAGAGVAATARASGVSERAFAPARGVARTRSRSVVAPAALIDGLVSVAVMVAVNDQPAARPGAAVNVPNSRIFLRKKSQKRLIGMLK